MTIRQFCAGLALVGAATVATGAGAQPCSPEDEARLNVNVQGVRSSEGEVAITVYSDRKSEFLRSGTKLERNRVPAEQGVTRDCLVLPGPGTYAVTVYHDEDGDRDFDRSMIGMPAEGYGFSNDPATVLSLPSFEDVLVEAAPGDTEITITVMYPD